MFQRLQDLKKQIFEYLEYIQNRILENNTYNTLKEKYQASSVMNQKIIKYVAGIGLISVISFAPLYYFYISSGYWSELQEKRNLSLKLVKSRHQKNQFSKHSKRSVYANIERIIRKYQEANYTIKDQPTSFKKKQIQKVIFDIKVKHLNIRQAMRMGTELNNIPPAYLSSLTIEESELYPKHYDVNFLIFAYFENKRGHSRFNRNKPKHNQLEKKRPKKNPVKEFQNKNPKMIKRIPPKLNKKEIMNWNSKTKNKGADSFK